MNVEFHPDAEAELMAARRWYEARSEIAARAFTAEVTQAIRRIREAPSRWKRHLGGTRRSMLPSFPFAVIYRERDDRIEIVAVAHHRRRPGYWIGR